MSEEEKLEEKSEVLEAELVGDTQMGYVGQQLNHLNGEFSKLNKNIKVFGFLHKDLTIMNNYLYWISLTILEIY